MRDRSKVPPSRASARNGRGRNFGTFTERRRTGRAAIPVKQPELEEVNAHKEDDPAAEPMTREQWIAYHVARAPKITKRQWADMLLLLHYGNQETYDDDQGEEKAS